MLRSPSHSEALDREPPKSRRLDGQLLFLGTGTSVGVPLIGCDCPVCTSNDPRNKRTRCGVAIGLPQGTLLIDTPTDLRTQLLREGIALAQAVAYTHAHADHTHGIDELRVFTFWNAQPVPLYCEATVAARLRECFSYCFQKTTFRDTSPALPQLEVHPIGTEPFSCLGATIQPIRLMHGRLPTLGFRIGNVAYCTDVSEIPPESLQRLTGLDVLILDCLRDEPPHPTHLTVAQAIELAEQIGARRTIFTHISHSLDHESTNRRLPAGMELAYDGMVVPLSGGSPVWTPDTARVTTTPRPVLLRPFEPDDLAPIRQLNDSAVPAVNAMPLEVWQRLMEQGFCRLAENQGQSVGFVLALFEGLDYPSLNYRWFSERYETFLYVDRIVIADGQRGLGLGRLLYDELFAEARRRGLRRVLCEVNVKPMNDGSLRFHERLGFQSVGEQETEGGTKRVRLLCRELD